MVCLSSFKPRIGWRTNGLFWALLFVVVDHLISSYLKIWKLSQNIICDGYYFAMVMLANEGSMENPRPVPSIRMASRKSDCRCTNISSMRYRFSKSGRNWIYICTSQGKLGNGFAGDKIKWHQIMKTFLWLCWYLTNLDSLKCSKNCLFIFQYPKSWVL